MRHRTAQMLVFGTSFCILVLEILAGRLLAPHIGVSLETFTGIIGTVLAGIALGNAVGGRLADRRDPAALLGPALVLGGVTTWAAPLLTSALGPAAGTDPAGIVFLTAFTFFVPAAVLSAVSPLVAKLRLQDLDTSGRVVGSLSAASTAGALAGTFVTGFVLVAAFSTRAVIVAVGLVLVAAGGVLTGWARLARSSPVTLVAVLALGVGATIPGGPCRHETAYACVQILPDPEREGGRTLVLNGDRNSYVDLGDPTYLDFRYLRLFADAAAGLDEGPVRALHVGGAGFSFPRYLDAVRPGSTNLVLEIDPGVVTVAQQELGLELSSELAVITGDARLTVAGLSADQVGPRGVDLIAIDAFSGLTVPWHLTTTEFVSALDRVLAPDGIVVINLIDGGDLAFARAQAATYGASFEYVAMVTPPPPDDGRAARNLIVLASHRPLDGISVDAADGHLLDPSATRAVVGNAAVLVDDYAPVDQLRRAR